MSDSGPQTTPRWPEGCAELDQSPGPVATCRAAHCVCMPETNAPPSAPETTDIVARLCETLTGEPTDEDMMRRIVRERAEAADTIHALRVKLHRERSKIGALMAEKVRQR